MKEIFGSETDVFISRGTIPSCDRDSDGEDSASVLKLRLDCERYNGYGANGMVQRHELRGRGAHDWEFQLHVGGRGVRDDHQLLRDRIRVGVLATVDLGLQRRGSPQRAHAATPPALHAGARNANLVKTLLRPRSQGRGRPAARPAQGLARG